MKVTISDLIFSKISPIGKAYTMMLRISEFLHISRKFRRWFSFGIDNFLNSRWDRNKNFGSARSRHVSEELRVQEESLSLGSESVKFSTVREKSAGIMREEKSLRERNVYKDLPVGKVTAEKSERQDSQEDLERHDREERSRRGSSGQDASVLSLPLDDLDHRIAGVLAKYGTGTSLSGVNYSTYVHDMRLLRDRYANTDPSERRRMVAALREKRFVATTSHESGRRSLWRPDEVYLPDENADGRVKGAGRRFRLDPDWLPLGDDPARDSQLIHLLTDCGVKAHSDREWFEAA